MLNKPKKITSKQVAKIAGVSQTTVSFVLNNVEGANISEETRQRVLQVAQELNYVPDVAARSLARGRGNNIALVIAEPHPQVFIDEFIPKILTGINQVTQTYDFRILVEFVKAGAPAEQYTRLLHTGEAAGIILTLPDIAADDPIRQAIRDNAGDLPMVSLADVHTDIPSVVVDKFTGVRNAVQHLIDLGHQRIACISYSPKNRHTHTELRLKHYRDTLLQAGLPVDETLVRYGNYDPDTGYSAMKDILAMPKLPTALFALNDVMAFGAIAAIHEHGLRIPEDIAVVGFDDIRLAGFTTPPLTTVNELDMEQGYHAAEMLLAMINGRALTERHLLLPTKLVVRQSCGALKK